MEETKFSSKSVAEKKLMLKLMEEAVEAIPESIRKKLGNIWDKNTTECSKQATK
jgi:hypothetical protein